MSVAFSKQICVVLSDRKPKTSSGRLANHSNLVSIKCRSETTIEKTAKTVKLALLNIRSLNNKSLLVNDFINTNCLDFMLLTETWLDDSCSAAVLNEAAPLNFDFLSVCRANRRG